jgi:hypothetical protein
MHLTDLKDDLENGDSSDARILINVELETDLRNFFRNRCRDKAQGRYTIAQEEEFADAKKADLRFHGLGFDAPVPVELKIADKWTGPKLFERLENQLCGDYLRDTHSSFGIFLLVNRGVSGQSWQIPNKKLYVDFNALLSALQTHWLELADKFLGIDQVEIIGIDLTKRKFP